MPAMVEERGERRRARSPRESFVFFLAECCAVCVVLYIGFDDTLLESGIRVFRGAIAPSAARDRATSARSLACVCLCFAFRVHALFDAILELRALRHRKQQRPEPAPTKPWAAGSLTRPPRREG